MKGLVEAANASKGDGEEIRELQETTKLATTEAIAEKDAEIEAANQAIAEKDAEIESLTKQMDEIKQAAEDAEA